jgi:hypothetical protein
MVKVKTDTLGKPLKCEIYLDGYLKNVLEDLQSYVDKDWDGIGIIFGDEGDGKSSAAMMWAYCLDSTLTLERIVFTPEQFEEAVDQSKPNQAIIWDEADEITAHWASTMITTLKRRMKTMRDKNLKVFLVTPTIFDIKDKYFAIGRTRFAIHVYAEGFERGYFRFFNKTRKKKLYLMGRKEWDLRASKPNFIGRFTKIPSGFPIDYDEYKNKKQTSTIKLLDKNVNRRDLRKTLRQGFVLGIYTYVWEKFGYCMTQKELAKVIGCSQQQVSTYFVESDLKPGEPPTSNSSINRDL